MAAKKKNAPKKKSAPKKKASSAKKSAAKKPAAKKTSAKSSKKTSSSKAKTKTAGKKRVVRTSKRPSPRRKIAVKPTATAKAVKAVRSGPAAAPEALALAKSIAGVAAEKKAENVMVIDTRSRAASVGYDYVVLASGETDRQLTAIHEGVEALLKPQGKRAASVEASPDWVCVNYDAGVVAHFFTPDKRDMMDLEGLWKDAPRVAV